MTPRRPLESEIDAALAGALPLLTVKEAADVLRLHHRTVRERVYDKTLSVVRLGRELRIPRDSLARFMRAR